MWIETWSRTTGTKGLGLNVSGPEKIMEKTHILNYQPTREPTKMKIKNLKKILIFFCFIHKQKCWAGMV